MKNLLVVAMLFVSASSFANTLVGHIANYDCTNACRITTMGTIDYGNGNTSTQIMTLEAAQYTEAAIAQLMNQGPLAIELDSNSTAAVNITPYSGKTICGQWNGWTNCSK